MIRVIFLLSVFTLVSRCAFSQTDFRPGLVILLNGDTIHGEIDYRGDEMMGMMCRFRSTNTTLREYRPVDLRAYQFIGGKYYISRDVKRNNGLLERAFLEYVIGGKVTFYYIRELEGGERFFLDKDGAGFTELTYSEKIEFKEGKQVRIQSTTHIGLLNFYLKEAPKLQGEISKIERPNRAQLTKVIHEYHTIIDKEKGPVVFQQKFPGTQIFLEPLIGSAYYKGANLNTNYSFIGGLNIHLGMPRYNEKLFFRTGIFFSRFDFSEGAEMFLKSRYRWSICR